MARAEAGQVLTTEDVLERSRTRFETTELGPFRAKGKEAPVVPHEVHAVAGEKKAAPATQPPFIGRERELAILGASLGPVRMGFGSLVELVGDPGMGKSRLVEELQAQSADMTSLSLPARSTRCPRPTSRFARLLRSLLDVSLSTGIQLQSTAHLHRPFEPLAPELLPWIPLLAVPLDVELESTPEVDELQPAFRRARLHGVAENIVRESPADAHARDRGRSLDGRGSCDLLRHLGGHVTGRPWLICADPSPRRRRIRRGGGCAARRGARPPPRAAGG